MEDKLFKLINPLSNLNFNTGFHSISSTTFLTQQVKVQMKEMAL